MGGGWQHKDDIPEPPGGCDYGMNPPSRCIPLRRKPWMNTPDLEKRIKATVKKSTDGIRQDAQRGPLKDTQPHINCRCTINYPTAEQAPAPSRSYTMNTKEAITLIQLSQGAKIVAASYMDPARVGKPISIYHFKDVLGLDLAEGDTLVVQTGNALALVTVTCPDVLPTDCGCSLDKLKHVVCKVDTGALDTVMQTERKAVHKMAISEVNDRLRVYQEQLGTGFNEVARMLAPAAQPAAPNDYWGEAVDGRPRHADGSYRTGPVTPPDAGVVDYGDNIQQPPEPEFRPRRPE